MYTPKQHLIPTHWKLSPLAALMRALLDHKTAISHSCIHMMFAISVVVIAGMILRILDVWRLLLPPLGHTHIYTSGNRQKKYILQLRKKKGQSERRIAMEVGRKLKGI